MKKYTEEEKKKSLKLLFICG